MLYYYYYTLLLVVFITPLTDFTFAANFNCFN